MTLLTLGFFIICISLGIFIYIQGTAPIGRIEKEEILNYYSSLLSDMNVDYREVKISPENIRDISTSIANFTEIIEKNAPNIKKSSSETQVWFLEIINEFHSALSLWTERHADEIALYEKSIENPSTPTLALLTTRLKIQGNNLRKIIS